LSRGVVLIGLGQIAYRYDSTVINQTQLGSEFLPTTHYYAAIQNGFEVVAGVDPVKSNREKFEKLTSIKTFENIEALSGKFSDVLAVICTPKPAHAMAVMESLTYLAPSAIVCEKPLGSNLSESKQIIKKCKTANVPLIVNYTRQFSPGFRLLKRFLNNSKLVGGSVIYSGGLRENGSHFLRLVLGLVGRPSSCIPNESRNVGTDPNFELIFSGGARINFTGLAETQLHLGELILVFEEFSVIIQEGFSFRVYQNLESRFWPRTQKAILEGFLDDGMRNLYFNIANTTIDSTAFNTRENELDIDTSELMNLILSDT
jgi:hypothetical protein